MGSFSFRSKEEVKIRIGQLELEWVHQQIALPRLLANSSLMPSERGGSRRLPVLGQKPSSIYK